MANIDFQILFNKLKEEAIGLTTSTVKKYKTAACADLMNVLEDMKENLESWTIQLEEGKLSKEDFEFLVLGQKELIEMNALKQAGVALIKADELKNSLLNLIVNTVTSFL